MHPIRLFALDLDGTLAIAGHAVTPRTRDALQALHGDGVEVVIATGRRFRTTRYVIDNLGFDTWAICNGGALIKQPDGTTFKATAFAAGEVADLVAIARSAGITLFAQRDAHGRGGADFVIDDALPWNEGTKRYANDNAAWSTRADLAALRDDYLVCGGFADEPVLRAYAASIAATFGDRYTVIIVPHAEVGTWYCEVTRQEICKWYGLTLLAAHLAVDTRQTCVVGDQLNDMTMVTNAAHGIAMGNGHPDLQSIADFVCGNHDEDGLLHAIDYIRTHNERHSLR